MHVLSAHPGLRSQCNDRRRAHQGTRTRDGALETLAWEQASSKLHDALPYDGKDQSVEHLHALRVKAGYGGHLDVKLDDEVPRVASSRGVSAKQDRDGL